MSAIDPKQLAKAPIVEAVIDIDCDFPAQFDLAAVAEVAKERFRDNYPKSQKALLQQLRIESNPENAANISSEIRIGALRFTSEDERQIVQIRSDGFSFNRLAPYTSMDEYLIEIQRTWTLFLEIAAPVQLRAVRLRYINRISLPVRSGILDFDHYFKVGPKLPDEDSLQFVGFFHQHTVVEKQTGHTGVIVLASQLPEADVLPVIFDITVGHAGVAAQDDWNWIDSKIQALRGLKNRIFTNTLTETCLNLFQQ